MTQRFGRPSLMLMAVGLIVLGLSTGCGAGQSRDAVEKGAVEAQDTVTTGGVIAEPIEPMSIEQKRKIMAEGFPVEVPVPDGRVGSASTQGPDAWSYEVEVPNSPDALYDWYFAAYTGRSWTVVGEGLLSDGGSYLELRKNAAQSRVDILSDPDSSGTTARVVVGVGAPILETY